MKFLTEYPEPGFGITIGYRSSHRRRSVKKDVLKSVAKFTEKYLCGSFFFNKVASLTCSFIKKETRTQVFSCEFCKILRTPFLKNIYRRLLNIY